MLLARPCALLDGAAAPLSAADNGAINISDTHFITTSVYKMTQSLFVCFDSHSSMPRARASAIAPANQLPGHLPGERDVRQAIPVHKTRRPFAASALSHTESKAAPQNIQCT